MMLIDAHAHIFPRVHGITGDGKTRGKGHGRIQMGAEIQQLFPPYGGRTIFSPEMLIANLDWAGVEKAVLLQGPFYGECNAYVLKALNRYPERLVGMAYLDPWDGQARKNFEWIMNAKAFQGIKLECSEKTGLAGIHPSFDLGSSEVCWLWEEMEALGMVLVLDLGTIGSRSYQTGAVRDIATSHPQLKIVIAHLGQPRPEAEKSPELWKLWIEQIDLGKLENVWFDCAALPAYTPEEDYPFPSAGRYLRTAVERIGSKKILWGSDQPGLLSHASLPQLVAMIKLHTRLLSFEDQALVLGLNASQVFRI